MRTSDDSRNLVSTGRAFDANVGADAHARSDLNDLFGGRPRCVDEDSSRRDVGLQRVCRRRRQHRLGVGDHYGISERPPGCNLVEVDEIDLDISVEECLVDIRPERCRG
jgi:hypothetical protein